MLETLWAYEHIFPKNVLENIYAHTDDAGNYESMEMHGERTLSKANDIISKLHLSNILTTLNGKLYTELNSNCPNDTMSQEEFNSNMKVLLGTIIYLHDIGKINKKYQHERLENNGGGIDGFINSYHSAYGHMLINQLLFSKKLDTPFYKNSRLEFCAIVLTTIINRHHTPLLDVKQSPRYNSRGVWDNYSKQIDENSIGLANACKQSIVGEFDIEVEQNNKHMYSQYLENGRMPDSMFFMYKLWYSILVQADCFAAELFSEKKEPEINFIDKTLMVELQNNFYSTKEYNSELGKKDYLLGMPVEKIEDINALRTRMLLEACHTLRKHGEKRIFYLDVPTGGGKTNISIKLALDLVGKENLVRINYVFPFVNIIEQNHSEIEKTLRQEGKDTISKIYMLSDWGFDGETEKENFRLRNQRFLNYPVNVVSNANFFNIFLKNSKKATIKILELCNSVVILDEIQSLPNKKWIYFVTLLKGLSELYNIYFIIMSATLPDLRLLLGEEGKKQFDAINLLAHPEIYAKHSRMKRVTYQIMKDADPENEIDEIFKIYKNIIAQEKYKKILIVVNTIADSIEIYKKIASPKGFKVFLLNSATLSHRKKEVIDSVKSEQNVILVSTQSVEAGVDIDCDVGIRSDAPLDSIEQVAGRVNRNGVKSVKLSKVFVVPSKSKKNVYAEDIRNMFDITGVNGLDCETLLLNRDFDSYYRKIMERVLEREDMTKTNKSQLLEPMNNLEFDTLNRQDYIESKSFSIFLPVKIDLKYFTKHMEFINRNNLSINGHLDGKKVWEFYIGNKDSRFIGANNMKKMQILIQSFCINLTEPKSSKNTLNFREFIKSSLNFAQESEQNILFADENFVNKYFDENFGLDIQKIRNDFKESRDMTII
ncbi:MAG: CRISPR-associated helicase Cas3' [Candidatus Aenigmarchaeota archaeon]|nr:CRISPR-associated helicase Cas3' [Candidatus Aenigmarchaeota archaeon]